MTDIFHEVEEDLRREKWDALLKKYGPYLVAAGAAFIIILGGSLWFASYQEEQRAARSDRFLAAVQFLEQGDSEKGIAALDSVIADKDKGYAALALLRKGEQLSLDGDKAGAVAAYDQLAASSFGDKMLRDLARVKAGWLVVESEDDASLQSRLGGVANGDGIWAAAAQEILAFGAYRDGRLEEARSLYLTLVRDPRAAGGIASRSNELLSIIESKIGPVVPMTDTVPAETPSEEAVATDAEAASEAEAAPSAPSQPENGVTPTGAEETEETEVPAP